jgi:SAM-dependent methyltransferase
MSGFSAEWLALREPYDQAARSRIVLDACAAAVASHPRVTVTDLGCGTGSTLRALSPRLAQRQHWRLIDNDEALLATARKLAAASALDVTTVVADLAREVGHVLVPCDLIATSALLDLVSQAWLERLVAQVVRFSCPFYAALSYDGSADVQPSVQHDATVIEAVNRHQRTDKGFGPALGPDAARTAPKLFRAAGFTVVEGRSDWQFEPYDRDIQTQMLAGWAGAAGEIGMDSAALDEWLEERRGHVAAGRSQMRVGHVDFFARPTDWR